MSPDKDLEQGEERKFATQDCCCPGHFGVGCWFCCGLAFPCCTVYCVEKERKRLDRGDPSYLHPCGHVLLNFLLFLLFGFPAIIHFGIRFYKLRTAELTPEESSSHGVKGRR